MSPIQKQLELSSACFRVVGHVVEAQLRFATVLTKSMIEAPFAQVRALRAAAARPVAPVKKPAAPAPAAAETPASKPPRAAKTAVKAAQPAAAPRARRTRAPATPPAMP